MVFGGYVTSFFKCVKERRFIYYHYEKFIKNISDSSDFIIVPLKDFTKTHSGNHSVISIRHDVDRDLDSALEMARIEHKHGVKSTYFILHTARYYSVTRTDHSKHNENIIPVLKKMQDEYGHEIGWHNDLVTLQCVFGIEPKRYLRKELRWLKKNGIDIRGVAAHGSKHCKDHGYLNNYFFIDFPETDEHYPNNECVMIDRSEHTISKASLEDFGFEYEAYHLDNDRYFSDCSRIGSKNERWHPEKTDIEDFHPGDRVILLFHPYHWDRSVCSKYRKRRNPIFQDQS